ncbi:XdhC family protein [uncultured Azohydromonas sp.]|jgi:Xanthine and CO dehydrogenases maturation factor, XdhC/CoxF family|uniref:XdhC family protein n=1 Tax=uncultured Azohydromonas sp. TaxID=487342 RepID=UPI002620A94D|nr:XdhC family protein [uncultured Azohydromonas sp.]
MEAVDLEVMRAALAWAGEGRRCWSATVLGTYGSAPRPVGAMALLCEDGRVAGSVSGGCVEDDLTALLRADAQGLAQGRRLVYGRSDEERARLRLPCGGSLELWAEPAPLADFEAALRFIDAGQGCVREIALPDGRSHVRAARPGDASALARDQGLFTQRLGPRRRLVLIGAAEVSRYLAPIARTLDFEVIVIDPRREYLDSWPQDSPARLLADMPDDALAALRPDASTAVVALSHDPKLDDMALLEALPGTAFYVGAMGSARSTAARRERLALFELAPEAIARLRGPAGLDLGSRTPPEIAVAIAAELIQCCRAEETRQRRQAAAQQDAHAGACRAPA